MPVFSPFRGLRYDLDAASASSDELVAPPYDVVDDDEHDRLSARHPNNAVRLILPRGDDPYADAARLLAEWRRAGILTLDLAPAYYGYTMTTNGAPGGSRRTRGVIGALDVTDPEGVLPHERTLPKAKSDRLALLEATGANLDPIWGLSPTPGLSALLPDGPVVASCVDDDGVRHELVPITDPTTIDRIRTAVDAAPLVLADGHHRYETARRFHAEGGGPGSEAIMAFVVELADDELDIRPIHRLLREVVDDPRAALTGAFTVEARGTATPEGVAALEATMARDGALGWVDGDGLALLRPRPGVAAPADVPEPARSTDASLVEAAVLPVLAPREVEYRADAATVAALVDKADADAAVLLRPVSVEDTRAAAAAGVRFPQKTTFFWPKPRTGLVFRLLAEG